MNLEIKAKKRCAEGSSYGNCCGRLESHHIDPIKQFPEKRFDVDNGVTLCRCHHPRKLTEVIALATVLKGIVAKAERKF